MGTYSERTSHHSGFDYLWEKALANNMITVLPLNSVHRKEEIVEGSRYGM